MCTRRFSFHEIYNFCLFNLLIFIFFVLFSYFFCTFFIPMTFTRGDLYFIKLIFYNFFLYLFIYLFYFHFIFLYFFLTHDIYPHPRLTTSTHYPYHEPRHLARSYPRFIPNMGASPTSGLIQLKMMMTALMVKMNTQRVIDIC